ncbi:MAG TPA: 3-phosphoshikimate 1-carboxyvinyltransferase [Methanomassiliicoccales archaeon]|nr:3-phosphoshikimate 1-carboxyvinyltransferase [Methanomassiliicoccales archaeon]
MKMVVTNGQVEGAVDASPSKSYTHRALVLASLAEGSSTISRPLLGGDTLATLAAIRSFGAGTRSTDHDLMVLGGKLHCPDDVIDAANSGTTIRLMAGIASLLPCHTVLTGDESIRRRPMQPLIDALRQLGVECHSSRGNGLAPLIVRGPNVGKKAAIPGDVSSQFISSLLISSPLKSVDTRIELTTELKSRPYVDMTIEMMARFGVHADVVDDGFFVSGGQSYLAQRYEIPGDYSSAAFPLAAGALTGKVEVRRLDPSDLQGDRVILDLLRGFGTDLKEYRDRVVSSRSRLRGCRVDLGNAPDLFPIIAVLASQAEGRSVLENAEHVRYKESDRISATLAFLRKMGAKVEERPDGCVIDGPCRLQGAEVDSLGDHRILMAAAVAGLVADGTTTISEGDCYKISYPGFMDDMISLGATMGGRD